METLLPLSQAAQLLQVNKTTDGDAKEIMDRCPELSPVQVSSQAGSDPSGESAVEAGGVQN